MASRYRLDTKIKALNLLDEHDGDLQFVKEELGLPVKTLANWRRAELDLRQRYYNGQQHHFYNLKFRLLGEMLIGCEEIMRQINDLAIKDRLIEGASMSQRAYTLSVLLSNAAKLEEEFKELEKEDRDRQEPNRMVFVDDAEVQKAPPWAGGSAESPGPVQSHGMRKALGQIGIGQDRHSEGCSPKTPTMLVAGADAADGEPGLA